MSDSKWNLHGPAKSKLISKEDLLLAMKENPPKVNWKEALKFSAANAVSALYPAASGEKRLLDAMLLAVPR